LQGGELQRRGRSNLLLWRKGKKERNSCSSSHGKEGKGRRKKKTEK